MLDCLLRNTHIGAWKIKKKIRAWSIGIGRDSKVKKLIIITRNTMII